MLIWTLIFSTFACFILQEASARITAVSGINLGQAIKKEYGNKPSGKFITYLSLIAIISGCAAFEAGNILGAISGIAIISESIPTAPLVLLIGAIAATLLWSGNIYRIATLLGLIVAVMGICFLTAALSIPHDISAMFAEGLKPGIPSGSELVVLGLIGTTVVPYNIFLGSGLKHAQTPQEMKTGLLIAIGLGGFISIAILLTGTAVVGEFSFASLAEALNTRLGPAGGWILGIGLFGAGLSSTLTAALAAAITAKSLLQEDGDESRWGEKSIRFRSVWIGVLITGLIFGLLNVQPIPVIILAQALNGAVLPIIAVILFLLMNNSNVLPTEYQNKLGYNIVTSLVVFLTILIGTTNVIRTGARAMGVTAPDQSLIFYFSLGLFLVVMIPVLKKLLNHK